MTNFKKLSLLLVLYFSLLLSALHVFSQDFLWNATIGTSSREGGWAIDVDEQGSVYTIGDFMGTLDLDPGIGVFNVTSSGFQDVFIQKLDKNGHFLWGGKFGGLGGDGGRSITIDSQGNIYIVGYYRGQVDFDIGPGEFLVSSPFSNGIDGFVLKLSPDGSFIWVKNFGSSDPDRPGSVAIDKANNVVIIGQFGGTVDFDPGGGTTNLTSNGGQDIFLLKLNPQGDFIWAKSLGGTGNEVGTDVAIDPTQNILAYGIFSSTVDFDPGIDVFNLVGGHPTIGDVFLLKLDQNGNFLWAKKTGSMGVNLAVGIAVNSKGEIYSSGTFSSPIDLNPNTGNFERTPLGLNDIFVQKLDAQGNFLWAYSIGGTGGETGAQIALSPKENVFLTGTFNDVVDFDPGPKVYNLTSLGKSDVFIQKINPDGKFLWARQIGGSESDYSSEIISDDESNIYLTGGFQMEVDFDPGEGNSISTSLGELDVYVLKLGDDELISVPTLPQWALILFTLITLNLGIILLFQKRMKESN